MRLWRSFIKPPPSKGEKEPVHTSDAACVERHDAHSYFFRFCFCFRFRFLFFVSFVMFSVFAYDIYFQGFTGVMTRPTDHVRRFFNLAGRVGSGQEVFQT